VVDPGQGHAVARDRAAVTREQAYEQLLTALRLQGSRSCRRQRGRVLRKRTPNCRRTVVSPQTAAPRGDQLVTQSSACSTSRQPHGADPAAADRAEQHDLGVPQTTRWSSPTSDNLRRIQRIIESIDTPATSTSRSFHQVRPGDGNRHRPQPRAGRRPRAPAAVDAGQRTSVMAEPRTNSLILRRRASADRSPSR